MPGEDRLAVTVELEFEGARVVRAAFTRSLIRSDERLDYDRVDRIFAGGETAQRAVGGRARGGARARRARSARARMRRGGLEIAATEPEFALRPRAGDVRVAARAEQTESHRLIEHLMIAANEQVATVLAERGEPALYRVHEEPDPERVERLRRSSSRRSRCRRRRSPSISSRREAGELVGEISQARRALRAARAAAAGAPSAARSCARSSRPTTRRATSVTPACARRATATSHRRSAATRTSSATARCSR